MLTALYSGISGLRSHQTFLDVVGNNIANINTPGFKESRVRFADLLSQDLTSAAAGNPAQVGLGVRAAGIDKNFSQGSVMQTGNVLKPTVQAPFKCHTTSSFQERQLH
ncbi:MAG: flagellar hook-basal body complex protein [Planctomycetes bacterium]|nr:flagellar hook-basal body complex protein [Planctomycetota bacterium]